MGKLFLLRWCFAICCVAVAALCMHEWLFCWDDDYFEKFFFFRDKKGIFKGGKFLIEEKKIFYLVGIFLVGRNFFNWKEFFKII